jgi:hypothetical protein
VAAADQTPESPQGWHTFTEAGSCALPGRPQRFEDGGFALTGEEHRNWIKLHSYRHQGHRQDWGTQLKASSPSTRRRHRHPHPIRHAPQPEPTDDTECQSVADDLNRV